MARSWLPTSLRSQFAPRTWRAIRVLIAAFAVLCTMLLLTQPAPEQMFSFSAEKAANIYYQRDTPSLFPPNSADSMDPCANFPPQFLEDIQFSLKTGIGEIDRAQSHLNGTSACFKNVIAVGDVDMQVDGHHLIDIIADLPASYHVKNPDLDIYTKQKEALKKGDSIGYSKDAWRLDRFKFLPMVERAYKTNPSAKWYVFSEADNYIFWDSMLRLLWQYDPREPLYFGSAVSGWEHRDFAYGGAGFVMSHALMRDFVGGVSPTVEYEALVRDGCCGDEALAYAIHNKTGVRVKGFYPMFTGEDIFSIPLDTDNWCAVMVSLHRAQPTVMKNLWHWERTRPYTEEPLVWSDLLHYTHWWLRDSPVSEFWDNLSDTRPPMFSNANASPKHCAAACSKSAKCLQYSYTKGHCRFSHMVKWGFVTKEEDGEFISGWDMDKLKALGFDPAKGTQRPCKHTNWRKPQKTPL